MFHSLPANGDDSTQDYLVGEPLNVVFDAPPVEVDQMFPASFEEKWVPPQSSHFSAGAFDLPLTRTEFACILNGDDGPEDSPEDPSECDTQIACALPTDQAEAQIPNGQRGQALLHSLAGLIPALVIAISDLQDGAMKYLERS